MKPAKSSFQQETKKKSYTRKLAVVVDTSLFFCACEQLCGVLLRSKVVVELDLTSSISLRACRLGPESFQIKACQKQIKPRWCLQDYKTFCVIALDSKRDPTRCFQNFFHTSVLLMAPLLAWYWILKNLLSSESHRWSLKSTSDERFKDGVADRSKLHRQSGIPDFIVSLWGCYLMTIYIFLL